MEVIKNKFGLDISPDNFERIARKIPISYYVKRNIPLYLDKDGDATYYNSLEDTVTLGYRTMAKALEKFEVEKELEYCIRNLIYHELSHALLTAKGWKVGCDRLKADVLNLFCDERIESVMDSFFLGANFKRNILLITGWKGEPPKDALDSFFQIVRFRHGKTEYINRVETIIDRYDYLTADPKQSHYDWDNYKEAIWNLFLDISKEWYEKNEPEKIQEENPNYESESEDGKKRTIERLLRKDAKLYTGNAASKKMILIDKPEGEPDDAKDGESGNVLVESDEPTKDLEDLLKEVEEIIDMRTKKDHKVQEMLDTALNKFIDNNLTDKISEIFENFTSRNKNNGAAIRRYSGVLDPRSVGRDDWRIFNYKSNQGPIHGYDKLHINLFVDTSGSFRSNDEKVNTILKSLDILEDKYPFFDFDLVTCQEGETIRKKSERYIQSMGGNDLDDDIHGIFKKLNPGNRLNYNIILFDGDAFSDDRTGHHNKNFSAFNSSRCSIISDDDNQSDITRYCPLANKTFVTYGSSTKSYADMLYDNILDALNRALL